MPGHIQPVNNYRRWKRHADLRRAFRAHERGIRAVWSAYVNTINMAIGKPIDPR